MAAMQPPGHVKIQQQQVNTGSNVSHAITMPTVLSSPHIASTPQHTAAIAAMPTVISQLSNASTTSAGSISVPTSTSQAATNQAAAAQMSPDTSKKKCKNFLSTLLRLAGDQPENVAINVKRLIQGLIDGMVQPEEFTNQLQRELNSSPQPCLIPFLKRSLPYLRHSLLTGELTIDGVNPPPQNVVVTLPSTSSLISAPPIQMITQQSRMSQPHAVRLMTTGAQGNIAAQLAQPIHLLNQHRGISSPGQRFPLTTVQVQQGKSILGQTHPGATVIRPVTTGVMTMANRTASLATSTSGTSSITSYRTAIVTAATATSSKEDSRKRIYAASTLREDDDINDVAAMGGVNLAEENQRILSTNAEIIGTQIRSCKDESRILTSPLQRRIKEIAARCGLEEPSSEVGALMSHAIQERLKTLIEQLGIISEHRTDNLKMDQRYEVIQDVRGQIKFLEQLDNLENKRHEEQEREKLMKAAKSRSKVEDPEQQKLKAKAKEIQKLEQDQLRQQDANRTALDAIGPRKKKLKLESEAGTSSGMSANTYSGMGSSFGGLSSRPQQIRKKRVTIKDLLFLLEQDRDLCHSVTLYKAFLK